MRGTDGKIKNNVQFEARYLAHGPSCGDKLRVRWKKRSMTSPSQVCARIALKVEFYKFKY